jgi:hypothetical protein
MKLFTRTIFLLILIFSSYHLIRDILQILGIELFTIDFLHRSHLWCKPFCGYVTFPLEIFGIIGTIIVLKRKSLDLLGVLVLLSLILWPIFQFLP